MVLKPRLNVVAEKKFLILPDIETLSASSYTILTELSQLTLKNRASSKCEGGECHSKCHSTLDWRVALSYLVHASNIVYSI
jgi:hypothetical protein